MSFRPRPAVHRWLWFLPLIAPIALALAHDRSALHPPRAGLKPTFPVQTRLELAGTPDPGGVVAVLASLTAWAPGEEIAWEITAPEGLTRLDGPERWDGQLGRGETRTFELHFRVVDGAPRELGARARINGWPRATAGASLLIDAGASDQPVPLRLSRDGSDLLQYQGEVSPP